MNPARPPPSREAVLRRNNVVVQGHGRGKPALVFVNGFGCEQSTWRSVAPIFAPTHRVVLFDHVGVGRSQRSAYDAQKYGNLQAYADDLLEVCDAAGANDAVLVGHSVGAMIGLLAAIRWPAAFRHLILLSATPCYLNDGSYIGGFERDDLDALVEAMDVNYRHWARQMAPLIMGHPERPELAWELESSFNRMDPFVARQFARLNFAGDHREDLAQLSTPTTILQCADDNMVPDVVAEFMEDSIADCERIRLQATGHCPQLSGAEEVVQVLRGLLRPAWIETAPAELGSSS